jgi:hypothetical protein
MMRGEAMRRLEVLAGTWRTTMRNAWFLDPPGTEVPGTTTIEWIGDAFLVFRWVAGPSNEMVIVLGRNDPAEAYTALYHDERGVSRVYAMEFDGAHWSLNREDTDMFQRFVAEVTPDRIVGAWQASEDRGASWRTDFELVLERA